MGVHCLDVVLRLFRLVPFFRLDTSASWCPLLCHYCHTTKAWVSNTDEFEKHFGREMSLDVQRSRDESK